MAATPLYRSMEYLRKKGYSVGKTEYRNKWAFVTHDLFNFIDLVAVRGDKPGVVAVQSTTVAHQAERVKKITAIREALVWLQAGNRIVVHGWRKDDAGRWHCTETGVSISDMHLPPEQEAPSQETDDDGDPGDAPDGHPEATRNGQPGPGV